MKSITAGTDIFGDYYRFRSAEMGIENTSQAINLSKQEQLLKAQQAANVAIDNDKKSLDLGIASELRQTSVDSAKVALENAQKQLTINSVKAEVETGTKDAQIDQVKTNLDNSIKDGKIKDFEIQLNKSGLTKSDPRVFRMLSELYRLAPESQRKEVQRIIKEWLGRVLTKGTNL
jgi:hypothetical protein